MEEQHAKHRKTHLEGMCRMRTSESVEALELSCYRVLYQILDAKGTSLYIYTYACTHTYTQHTYKYTYTRRHTHAHTYLHASLFSYRKDLYVYTHSLWVPLRFTLSLLPSIIEALTHICMHTRCSRAASGHWKWKCSSVGQWSDAGSGKGTTRYTRNSHGDSFERNCGN
jgi:hypothetical protein